MNVKFEDDNSTIQEEIKKPATLILYDKKPINDEVVDDRKFRMTTKDTVADVARLLNHDHVEFNGIKPVIIQQREEEIEVVRRELLRKQKVYDDLKTYNKHLEGQLKKLHDKMITLENVEDAAKETNIIQSEAHKTQLEEICYVGRELERVQKLYFMYDHMRVRTRDDVVDIKAICTKVISTMNIKKIELNTLQSTARSLNHEVSYLKTQYDAMYQEINSRRIQRKEQLQSLQTMAEEGETSVMKFQASILNGGLVSVIL